MTLPVGSVIDTIVLLNVLLMCAAPCAMFFFSLRRTFLVPAAARALGGISLRSESVFVAWVVLCRARSPRAGAPPVRPSRTYGGAPSCLGQRAFFLPAMVLRGPLLERAFVLVRCPCTGRPRRCRIPW